METLLSTYGDEDTDVSVKELLEWADAVCIGPGLSHDTRAA